MKRVSPPRHREDRGSSAEKYGTLTTKPPEKPSCAASCSRGAPFLVLCGSLCCLRLCGEPLCFKDLGHAPSHQPAHNLLKYKANFRSMGSFRRIRCRCVHIPRFMGSFPRCLLCLWLSSKYFNLSDVCGRFEKMFMRTLSVLKRRVRIF